MAVEGSSTCSQKPATRPLSRSVPQEPLTGQALTAVLVKIHSPDVAVSRYRRFERSSCLHLQPRAVNQSQRRHL